MAELSGAAWHDLGALFDGHAESVFLDDYGHLTEAGNAALAARIADLVAPLLEPSGPSTGTPPSS